MITIKAASNGMNALELSIAKLEAASQPMGGLCPKCHAFGIRVESDVARAPFSSKRVPMIKCRFCGFTEEKMRG